jgi:hypothetical protein
VWSAIKLEYRLTSTDGAGEVGHALALNWSFGI